MKFSSSEYQPYQKPYNSNNSYSDNSYIPKVKTPNYTTPETKVPKYESQQTSQERQWTPPKTSVPVHESYEAVTNTRHYKNQEPPVGVPMMPLYGYDNYDDSHKDWNYFRQFYPRAAKLILREVDEECDKLEYNGSCMFDEYPDIVYLGKIVDKIYEKTKHSIEEPIVYTESINENSCRDDEDEVSLSKNSDSMEDKVKANQYRRSNRPPVRSNNWLRDLVEILLYQEILNRRRRYRSRRRWF